MSNSIRFLHLRNHQPDTGERTLKGGKTIAYQIVEMANGSHTLEYVVAKCGKGENYNRHRGAMIAGGRLTCKRESCQRKYLKFADIPEGAKAIETLVQLEG